MVLYLFPRAHFSNPDDKYLENIPERYFRYIAEGDGLANQTRLLSKEQGKLRIMLNKVQRLPIVPPPDLIV